MARRITRRGLLKAGLIGVPAATATTGGGLGWLWASADLDTAGRIDFVNQLAVPPLAGSRIDETGARVFDLEVAAGERQFRPGRPTATWGVNGDYLGPTLRADRGETVRVTLRNQLADHTTLHWHGMHLPAAMDGGPHQMVTPTRTRTSRPRSTYIAGWRACSSSTIPTPSRPGCHQSTGWTTSR